MNRRSLLQLLSLGALPGLALGQSWPAKPLRWVVPFPPGGTTDVVTRLVAAEVSRSLQQPIAVDNKPLGGQVSVMFGNWPEFRAHVSSGKLVALGMATAARSVYGPDLPTLAEQGLPLQSNSWNGLLVRSGTPDTVVQRLADEVQKALRAQTVIQAFAEGGIAALPGTPEHFGNFIGSEIEKYAAVIRKAGITADN